VSRGVRCGVNVSRAGWPKRDGMTIVDWRVRVVAWGEGAKKGREVGGLNLPGQYLPTKLYLRAPMARERVCVVCPKGLSLCYSIRSSLSSDAGQLEGVESQRLKAYLISS